MKIINLNSNENLYNPYNRKDFLEELNLKEELFVYPDDDYYEIRENYAKYVGLEDKNIIAGNGSDEMLDLIISTYIFAGDKLMTLSPDFGMYDFYVKQNGGVICKYNFDKENFDLKDFIENIKKVNPKVLMFSNPNNPTGMALSKDNIKILLEELKSIKVVIDEAYYEFFGESVVNEINNCKNLIVTRTLSKAFGLASIRVGFLISNRQEVSYLIKNKVPFNINRISNKIANLALNNIEYMDTSVKKIIKERENLYTELKNIEKDFESIKFYKSYANYIYFEGRSVKSIKEKLLSNGIKIRTFDKSRARITIGTEEINNRLIGVIKNLVRGEEG
ncbi:MAG: pyridoxal phosphate-dependent aminotransferase [Sarcina sp.]